MIELNKENFDTEVTEYKEKPVFVDFWGDKCETCLQLMPQIKSLEEKYSDKIKFASLNINANRRLAISQRVLGLPTMVIYMDGEKKETLTPDKITSIDDVEAIIKKYC